MNWALRLLIILTLVSSMLAAQEIPEPASKSRLALAEQTRILILGDFQPQPRLFEELAGKKSCSRDSFVRGGADCTTLSREIDQILETVKPDFILHTGDLTDFNNGLRFTVEDQEGNAVETIAPEFDEWEAILGLFPKIDKLFPTVGNHEHYGELTFYGREEAGKLTVARMGELKPLTSPQVNALLRRKFRHLNQKATFLEDSGAYVADLGPCFILSFDGMELKSNRHLFPFLERSLSQMVAENEVDGGRHPVKPILVLNHYPFFSGKSVEKGDEVPLRDDLITLFDSYGVHLAFNGHEHFYLRYSRDGMLRAGYREPLPRKTTYITVSDLANPYRRSFNRSLEPGTNPDHVTFSGSHYVVVTLDHDLIRAETFGKRNDGDPWEIIDTVSIDLVRPATAKIGELPRSSDGSHQGAR